MNKLQLILFLTIVSLSIAAPARANMEKMGEYTQAVRQAADELQSANPDLSKKLYEFADKKEKWAKDKGEDWGKGIARKKEDVQKIREASGALKEQNDGLSRDLNGIADRWEEKLEKKEKKKD